MKYPKPNKNAIKESLKSAQSKGSLRNGILQSVLEASNSLSDIEFLNDESSVAIVLAKLAQLLSPLSRIDYAIRRTTNILHKKLDCLIDQDISSKNESVKSKAPPRFVKLSPISNVLSYK